MTSRSKKYTVLDATREMFEHYLTKLLKLPHRTEEIESAKWFCEHSLEKIAVLPIDKLNRNLGATQVIMLLNDLISDDDKQQELLLFAKAYAGQVKKPRRKNPVT